MPRPTPLSGRGIKALLLYVKSGGFPRSSVVTLARHFRLSPHSTRPGHAAQTLPPAAMSPPGSGAVPPWDSTYRPRCASHRVRVPPELDLRYRQGLPAGADALNSTYSHANRPSCHSASAQPHRVGLAPPRLGGGPPQPFPVPVAAFLYRRGTRRHAP